MSNDQYDPSLSQAGLKSQAISNLKTADVSVYTLTPLGNFVQWVVREVHLEVSNVAVGGVDDVRGIDANKAAGRKIYCAMGRLQIGAIRQAANWRGRAKASVDRFGAKIFSDDERVTAFS